MTQLTRQGQLLRAKMLGSMEVEFGIGYVDHAGRFVPVETRSGEAMVLPCTGVNEGHYLKASFLWIRAEGEVRWLTHRGLFVDGNWRTTKLSRATLTKIGEHLNFTIITSMPV